MQTTEFRRKLCALVVVIPLICALGGCRAASHSAGHAMIGAKRVKVSKRKATVSVVKFLSAATEFANLYSEDEPHVACAYYSLVEVVDLSPEQQADLKSDPQCVDVSRRYKRARFNAFGQTHDPPWLGYAFEWVHATRSADEVTKRLRTIDEQLKAGFEAIERSSRNNPILPLIVDDYLSDRASAFEAGISPEWIAGIVEPILPSEPGWNVLYAVRDMFTMSDPTSEAWRKTIKERIPCSDVDVTPGTCAVVGENGFIINDPFVCRYLRESCRESS